MGPTIYTSTISFVQQTCKQATILGVWFWIYTHCSYLIFPSCFWIPRHSRDGRIMNTSRVARLEKEGPNKTGKNLLSIPFV